MWACWTRQPFCTRYQFLVPHKQPPWPQRQVRVKRVRKVVASEITLPSYNHISLLAVCSHWDVMWQFHGCCCCVLRACAAARCESLHSLNSCVISRAWATVVTLWSLFELFHCGRVRCRSYMCAVFWYESHRSKLKVHYAVFDQKRKIFIDWLFFFFWLGKLNKHSIHLRDWVKNWP